ncbi:N-acetyl-alpha-D-glucosaminyl-diphospho-ditrans,octacis-undecaprenol 4-epimerase [Thauera sp. GDN1]|nr:N-acetyl-alpha-D-glucosaminyl-diphospho-ditrans,octacis-undecaprenol 4-epimerase [Thauera sp. GDN1]
MSPNKSRFLVTGSSGFVGRRIMTRLSTENAVVRGATRQPSDLRTDVPSPLLGDDAEWSPLLEQVDIVVHAAARAHVLNENAEDPLRLFQEVNTAGTLRLARQAAEVGVKRFLFLSSIGVNGTQSIKPFNESDTPQPVEPYAVSKREAEQGLMELSRETGMEVVIIRPPLVYGPSAPGNFGKLANAVRRGIPLPLGAVTQNRRTLVGLDNLVDLIMTCAYHPAAANQVFLAGDDEDLSTADLLHRMAKAFGVSPRLLPVPVPVLKAMARAAGKSGMVERLCGSLQVDITKAREVLGWKPPLTVDEGLARVAAGF